MIGKPTEWKPPDNISKKEFVGRRAFGSNVFDTSSSISRYKINVFMDDRMLPGLSVDRLGVKIVRRNILDYLRPLCDDMAKKGRTEFIGWAQLRVSDVQQKISATKAVNEDNPYHAEIDLIPYQNKQSLRAFAFELCVQASKHEFIPSTSGKAI